MREKGIVIILVCSVLFLFSGAAYGGKFFLEAKGMYFQPTDQYFKDIYAGGTFTYGGEIGIGIFKNLEIWAGGHYFKKTGKLTYTQEETTIEIMPICVGMRLRSSQGKLSLYVGAGVGNFQYKEENPIGTVDEKDIGYIGQVGVIFKIMGALFIDIKGNYSYCKVKPVGVEEVNLGGIHGGIGIGFEF